MKATNKILAAILALGVSAYAASAQDNNPPPSDGQQPPAQGDGGPGRMDGQHRPGGRGGFHLLPPRAEQRLQLTDDQKKQVAALEAETKAKLEKILTPEQMKKLSNMHPPMMGRGGPGMRGGPGGGDGNQRPPNGPPPGGNDGNNPPPGGPPGDQ